MKKEAEEKKLPPVYRGKWAKASQEEVEAAMAAGTPYCYRFRVRLREGKWLFASGWWAAIQSIQGCVWHGLNR